MTLIVLLLFVMLALGNATELNELLAQSSSLALVGESSSQFLGRMQLQASDRGVAAEKHLSRNPLCARYNPGPDPGFGNRPSSALVIDNCIGGETNYCWDGGVFVSSYIMQGDSPYSVWSAPPDFGGPVASCIDACGILFGTGSWECSTIASSINNLAHVSIIYEGCFVRADDFRQPASCPASPDVPPVATSATE